MRAAIRYGPLWLFLLVANTGCEKMRPQPETDAASTDGEATTTEKIAVGGPISDFQAKKVAEETVRKRQNLDRVRADDPVRKPDGTIRVVVWGIPAKPGGYYVIRLSKDGEVVDYKGGL